MRRAMGNGTSNRPRVEGASRAGATTGSTRAVLSAVPRDGDMAGGCPCACPCGCLRLHACEPRDLASVTSVRVRGARHDACDARLASMAATSCRSSTAAFAQRAVMSALPQPPSCDAPY